MGAIFVIQATTSEHPLLLHHQHHLLHHGHHVPQDPYGWFQWYCRFYLGRRSTDDARQVGRWKAAASKGSGRFRLQLTNKCYNEGKQVGDASVSPVIRQTMQHWAVEVS